MSENGLDPKSVEKKYLKTFGIAWPYIAYGRVRGLRFSALMSSKIKIAIPLNESNAKQN